MSDDNNKFDTGSAVAQDKKVRVLRRDTLAHTKNMLRDPSLGTSNSPGSSRSVNATGQTIINSNIKDNVRQNVNDKYEILRCNACNSSHGCKLCKLIDTSRYFTNAFNNKRFVAINSSKVKLDCNTKNIIYLITCDTCKIQYVGETGNTLKTRFYCHSYNINNPNKATCRLLADHFNNGKCKTYSVRIIEKISDLPDKKECTQLRLEKETYWIRMLRTGTPYGLNDKVNKSNNEAMYWNLNVKNRERIKNKRKRGRHNHINKNTKLENINVFIGEIYKMFNQSPLLARQKIVKTFMNLSKYNVKNILSYLILKPTNHMIDSIMIDIIEAKLSTRPKTINTKQKNKPYIIVPYAANIDRINFSKLFNDPATKVLWPLTDFKFSNPMITYSYDKPIGAKIFNYRQTIQNLDVQEFLQTGLQCNCNTSNFKNPYYQHIITGDLNIIENIELRNLISKGPKFRITKLVSIDECIIKFTESLNKYIVETTIKTKSNPNMYETWKTTIIENFKIQHNSTCANIILDNNILSFSAREYLKKFQETFVITVVDKASQNFAFICKYFYLSQIIKELEYLQPINSGTYKIIDKNENDIINEQIQYSEKVNIPVLDIYKKLPFIYIIPKFHKNPIGFRTIIASSYAATKPISSRLCHGLKIIQLRMQRYCKTIETSTRGINPFYIINNNQPILDCFQHVNKKHNALNISTYDFTTLYTKIKHEEIVDSFQYLLNLAFRKHSDGEHIRSRLLALHEKSANWCFNARKDIAVNAEKLLEIIKWLIGNTYFKFGNLIFQQTIGIPMGTDCAPYLANLFLHSYELKFIREHLHKDYDMCLKLNKTFRYIDDITNINGSGTFEKYKSMIYPTSLELKKINISNNTADVLDMTISITNKKFNVKLFDKRDAFNFKIINFPHFKTNLPLHIKSNIIDSQIYRFRKICTDNTEFINNTKILITKLIKERGYSKRIIRKRLNILFSKYMTTLLPNNNSSNVNNYKFVIINDLLKI